MKNLIVATVLVIILTSCAVQKTIYYWGNYSTTLYSYKQEPGEESLNNHKTALLEVFRIAEQKNKKVPPGLYSEYGYILFNEGNIEEAYKYFELEKKTYPESEIFMNHFSEKKNNGEEQ